MLLLLMMMMIMMSTVMMRRIGIQGEQAVYKRATAIISPAQQHIYRSTICTAQLCRIMVLYKYAVRYDYAHNLRAGLLRKPTRHLPDEGTCRHDQPPEPPGGALDTSQHIYASLLPSSALHISAFHCSFITPIK